MYSTYLPIAYDRFGALIFPDNGQKNNTPQVVAVRVLIHCKFLKPGANYALYPGSNYSELWNMVDNNTLESSMCRHLYEFMVDNIPGATLNIPVPTSNPSHSPNTAQNLNVPVPTSVPSQSPNIAQNSPHHVLTEIGSNGM